MVPTKVAQVRVPLDPEQMADVYEHIQKSQGSASVGKVADYLKGIGLRSRRTRKAYTRQNVFLALKRSKRYRPLVPVHPKVG